MEMLGWESPVSYYYYYYYYCLFLLPEHLFR